MFGLKSESLFSQSKDLERQIDEFVNTVSEVGLIFKRAIRHYLSNGSGNNFDEMVEQVSSMESKADKIKKKVETALYEDTLIPDARSDVLRLLEHLDEIIGLIQGNCYRFSIQKPAFPKDFHNDLINLTDVVIDSAESLCISVRSFFRDIKTVRDNAHKVTFYEKESDKQTSDLQRKIFKSDLTLDQKMHLRYFVEKIDQIADQAEDIADELQIYSIKRSI
tara:strand:+ start:626 stop:1288 length:663 start_codon:yes stop_codon:yes gene_type:complete